MSTAIAPPLSYGVDDAQKLVSWQRHYHLDDAPIATGLSSQVEPIFADLLDLAVAVYVSDRVMPRRPKYKPRDGAFWRRSIAIRVGVRELDRWTDPDTSLLLHKLLGWLTDDEWKVEFVSGPSVRRLSETQSRLFVDPPGDPTQVSLFSGGLDSLLGAAADATSGNGELVVVGAGTHPRMIGKQRQLIGDLAARSDRRIRSVIVPVHLTSAGKEIGTGEEPSQRSRGFVFLSLGAAVADAAGCAELRVHENGPGALNLSLTAAQQGSMNTRATRPETLQMMGALIHRLTGRPFEIRNPAFWSTKAEMCAAARPGLHALMAESVTCDGALTRRSKDPLCGTCTSCLLRRQALLASGLRLVDNADIERMAGDGLSATRSKANPMVLAMLQQVREIARALQGDDPWRALVERFPELVGARYCLDVKQERLVDLLERYVRDWRAVDYSLVREFLDVGIQDPLRGVST
ncbi:MAG TPA: 7-cyano-7-deazaguanine synthase [Solirubrobacterales bacterium]|nr:7-cyano-7-deazaguanine synthase [Solirubrobacterales bacterium]